MKKMIRSITFAMTFLCVMTFAGVMAKSEIAKATTYTSKTSDFTTLNNSKVATVKVGAKVKAIYPDTYLVSSEDTLANYKSILNGCKNVSSITVEAGNKYFKSVNGMLLNKKGTILYLCPPAKTGAVKVPSGVKQIMKTAFFGCTKITSIQLPKSLKLIEVAAFGNNTKLKSFSVKSGNKYFKVKSGVLFDYKKDTLIAYPSGKSQTTYTVPAGVMTIGEAAFYGNTKLKTVTLQTGLAELKNESFRRCSALKKVVTTSSLQKIDAGVFVSCGKLSNLKLREGLISISDYAFAGNKSLKTLSLPKSLVDFEISSKFPKTTLYVYKNLTAYKAAKSAGWTYSLLANQDASTVTIKAPASAVAGTGKADTAWYTGIGNTYHLSNPDQLAGLAELVNAGKNMKDVTIKLSNDMDMSCYSNWTPIGKSGAEGWLFFSGTFEGNNHTLYNLTLDHTTDVEGLFRAVDGTIQNLTIKYAEFSLCRDGGILVGDLQGTVSNCVVYGNITGVDIVGGMVGSMYENAQIKDCVNYATVNGSKYVGGVVGFINSGTVTNTTNYGMVKGYLGTGGIAGGVSTTMSSIDKCTNARKVNGQRNTGGIAGEVLFGAKVNYSTNKNSVVGYAVLGGIAGYSYQGSFLGNVNSGTLTATKYKGARVGVNVTL